ncbi:MAG: cell division protein SepF [Candidatus Parvarchaeota archaeon]|nr:cell division protein SepF [Candidatus Rehaiarchaeum fermentans]
MVSINPLNLFKKTVKVQENVDKNEYVELQIEKETEPVPKLYVKVYSVSKYEDSDTIVEEIRGGSSILIIKSNELKNKDNDEFTRFLAKIKKTADAVGAQIVGIDETLFVVAPSFVKIEKGALPTSNPPSNPEIPQ